jgi:large subunit ribosomal protein L18
VKGTISAPRLCVFRSLNHIYAQVIDDARGHTLVSASTLEPEIKSVAAGKTKTAESELVGSLVAKRALSQGLNQVAFDRGGCKYHGRVKALAEAARQEGLKF